jgi:transcriptional regulator with XRE-family HTH domain
VTTIPERDLQRWCRLANRAGRNIFGFRNSCIMTSHALAEFLRGRGLDAECVRVEVHAFGNSASFALGWDGDGSRRPASKPGRWRGHLAVASAGCILDPTIDQGGKGAFRLKPAVFRIGDSDSATDYGHGWQESGFTVSHEAYRKQAGWKSRAESRPAPLGRRGRRDEPDRRPVNATCDEPETWLPAHDHWAPLYEVCNLGAARSLDRVTPKGRHLRGRVLTPWIGPSGYLTVDLVLDGKHERWPVHQLVARVFIGPRPPGMVTRHGPNGKLDNRASQLCYGTKAEDIEDKVRDRTGNRGERQGNHKLTWEIAAEIRQRYADGERQADLSERFGIAQSGISQIVRGKTWRPYEGAVEAAEAWRRPPGFLPRARPPQMTAEVVKALHARYLAGEDVGALALELGCDRTTIYARFRRMNLPKPA